MKTLLLLPAPIVRVVAILFLVAVIAAPFAHSEISFYGTPTIPGCAAAVIGDFNRDGNLDIINCAGTVLLGNGNGTFTTGATLSNVPSFVADFNGDGIPDVLAFTESGHLFVYLGNGDGTFQVPKDTYTAVALSAGSLAVSDLVTGVDEADVVVMNPAGGVLVFLGKGDGTFQAPVDYASPAGGIFVGDFNGDGKPDILVDSSAGNSSSTSVFLGNGDGTFQTPITTTYPGLWNVVAVGDLNGDHRLDLLVDLFFDAAPTEIAVMLGNGDGTFQQPSNQFTPTVSSNPTLADVNGDGKLDLLIQLFPFMQVYLGNGDGTFSVGRTYSYNSVSLAPSQNILVGDFNGDGKPDITAAQSILFGNGDGTFQASPAVVLPNGDQILAAVSGDFNGDGRSDLAVTGGSGNLYIYLADATGTLSLAYTYAISAVAASLQTGDFNGDGKLDLIATVNSGGTIFWGVLLGNGNGSFGAPVESDACPPSTLYLPAVADLNGDHKSDLALPSGESLSICLGNGDGTFASPVNYFFGTAAGSVLVADFTNDGKLDAVVSGQAGVALFLGNGDGTFQGASYVLTTPYNEIGPIADFNQDGNLDLIINNTVFLGNGKGAFQSVGPQTSLLGGTAVDLNSDGYVDVFNVAQTEGRYLEVPAFLGNGNGTFQPLIDLEAGSFLSSFGLTGDFNGDGRPDLSVSWGYFAQGSGPGEIVGIQILLNTTPPAPGVTISPAALTFPMQVVGTSSSPLGVTLNNTGKGALIVSGVKFTGTNANEFSQTNNCASVQPGGNCTIKVLFTPTAGGNAAASLMISDNVVGSPQTVGLSGTATAAPDFTIGPASGSSSSATITAGQTASFNLTIAPAGSFSGTVSLSCAITPAVMPAPVCTVPSSVNVTQGTEAAITAKVSTTAAGTAGTISRVNLPPGMMPIDWTIVLLAFSLLFDGYRRRMTALAIPMMAVVLLGMTACGGGGGSSSMKTTGTPAGTYTVVVTAKSGGLNHSTTLTVIVQ